MARIPEYGRRHRLLMQGTMWLVLAGSLGVAQLVDLHKTGQASGAALEDKTRQNLGISYRLPKGWQLQEDTSGDERLVASAVEAQTDNSADRGVAIYCDRAPAGTTAEKYIRSSGLIQETFKGQVVLDESDPGTIAGVPAIRLEGKTPGQEPDGEPVMMPQTMLCAVLPDGVAISVLLWHDGQPDSSDRDLLDGVAGSISEVNHH